MKVSFKKSFLKELKKLKDKHLKDSVAACILQVESVSSVQKIKNIKKLAGYDHYYRIRVGDYRIGLKIEDDLIFFVVIEHRKDIYKMFP